MSDTKEELKPCPFCGKLPHTSTYYVGCDGCGVHFDRYMVGDDAAWKAWNTRPPSPALKVAREALEKCKADCSCGAMGCVGHDDTCPVHLKQNALALLAKEGV
jgi:hypothetical protein